MRHASAGAGPAPASAAPRPVARPFLDSDEPLAPPVRGPLFGMEGFRQHAAVLAQSQPVERRHGWRRPRHRRFSPQAGEQLRRLRAAAAYLQTLTAEGQPLGPAARALSAQLHALESRLPSLQPLASPKVFARLPVLRTAPLAGLPRLYGIAWTFVTHTDANLDANLLLQCLLAYQEVDELGIDELHALPDALRAVLLENLVRLAEAAATRQAAAELAEACCDAWDRQDASVLDGLALRLQRRGVEHVFLARLAQRLQALPAEDAQLLRTWLSHRTPDVAVLRIRWQDEEAADAVSLRHSIASLREVDRFDWPALIEPACVPLQRLLQSEPFRRESAATREDALRAAAALARRLRLPESEVAQRAVDLAEADARGRMLGPIWSLLGDGLRPLQRALGLHRPPAPLSMPWRCLLYIGGLVAGTLLLMVTALSGESLVPWAELLSVVLLAVPASEVVLVLLQRVLAALAPSRRLPRLALPEGLTAEQRTLVVLPCVLQSSQQVAALAQRLEQHWLAQRERHVQFALLSDWEDAPQRQAPGDALLLDAARTAIAVLNARHPRVPGDDAEPRFLLLHRERSWSAGEGAWIGWDRARGRREQLMAHLAGVTPSPFLPLGEDSRLAPDIRHVLTLEPDTLAPPGLLRELVAIAAHPMNAPRLDPATRRVVDGYAVLQPRLVAPLAPAPRPGEAAAWQPDELHQRLFAEARFRGQGLMQVAAFQAATAGRVPEDRLPEASLYEGLWARCARIDELQLLQPRPQDPQRLRAAAERRVALAWQLLPLWPAALHGRVGLVNVWKLLDAVRQTLLAPTAVALLWWSFTLQAVPPLRAVLLVLGACALPPLLDTLGALRTPLRGLPGRERWREFGSRLLAASAEGLGRFGGLMSSAIADLHGIVATLWRLAVTRRGLLSPARVPSVPDGVDPRLAWHGPGLAGALAFLLLGLLQPGSATGWLAVTALAWLAAPALRHAATLGARERHERQTLGADERQMLWQLAREAWRPLEHLCGPAEHHLPPARIAVWPRLRPQHRSGPEAIGLALLATAAAHRTGLIGTGDLVRRLQQQLDTLERLPRHHGHLHQVVDTQTLRVLPPARIDTAASGLLAACLWAVGQACREQSAGPAPHTARERALEAALHRVRHGGDPGLREPLQHPALQALVQEDLWALWRRRPAHLRALLAAAQAARPAAHGEPPNELDDLLAQLDSLLQDRERDRDRWPAQLRALAARADTLVEAMDFALLYDPHRRLLHTGYSVEDAMPDDGVYESLGDLARLASFIAIAKGDVPVDHWHAMDRGTRRLPGRRAARTMSASLADALLPSLLLDAPPGSVLQASAQGAIDGAPSLEPGAAERVVEPWLATLALADDPRSAVSRLQRMERLGARGPWGLAERLTLPPVQPGLNPVPERSTEVVPMQAAAAVAAIAHAVADAAPRRWFSAVPAVRAHLALLQERPCPSREAVLLLAPVSELPPAPPPRVPRVVDPSDLPPAHTPTQLLGNGRYAVALRPHGSGESRWLGQRLHRGGDDLLRNDGGHWLMMRSGDEVEFHSLTRAPHPRPDAFYRTRFLDERVEFDAECDFWRSTVTAWVSTDDDIEFRQVSLQNLEARPVAFEVLSLLEVDLGTPDPAVPAAITRRRVEATSPDPRTLVFERRRREAAEAPLCVSHFLARCDVEPTSLRLIADRAQVMPRRAEPGQVRPGPGQRPDAQGALDTGGDPVAAIVVRVVVPPQSRVALTFATAAAPEPDTLAALADEYRRDVHVQRSRRMAAARMRALAAEVPLQPAELHALQDLATSVVSARSRLRQPPAGTPDDAVWSRRGIDRRSPLLLVRLAERTGVPMVQALRQAQQDWAERGWACELVVVDAMPPDPARPLRETLPPLWHELAGVAKPAARLHLLPATRLTPGELAALQAHAVVDLLADGRPWPQVVADALQAGVAPSRTVAAAAQGDEAGSAPDRRQRAALLEAPLPGELPPVQRLADGGVRLVIDGQRTPPRAWEQVLGRPGFGAVVTESGGGHTFAGGHRAWPLTPPTDDPLCDPAVEHFLVQDLSTLQWWGVLPTLDRNGLDGYELTHWPGASRFAHRRGPLAVTADLSVHPELDAKVLHVRLRNDGPTARPLRLFGLVEWQLAADRRARMALRTGYDPALQAATAEGPGGVAFLMLAGIAPQQWTCARDECFDASGRLRPPRALGGAAGLGADPCAAMDAVLMLEPGATASFAWVIGHAFQRPQALALAAALRDPAVLAQSATLARDRARAEAASFQVATPDPDFDHLVNHWLPWQCAADRDGLLTGDAGFDPDTPPGRLDEPHDEEGLVLASLAAEVLAQPPGDPAAQRLLATLETRLADRRARLLCSRTPALPALHGAPDAADSPGVGGNGGQRPVPAAWAVMALARGGAARAAWTAWSWLSPPHRVAATGLARWRGEPYALPTDISAAPGHEGEAGPGWGAGAAAAWVWRAAVDGLLGRVRDGGRVCFAPCLPPQWDAVRLSWSVAGRTLQVVLRRPGAAPDAPGRRIQAGEWIELSGLPVRSEWVVELPASPAPERLGARLVEA